MNRFIKFVFYIFIVVSANSIFACEYPEQVSLPKGNTATLEDMIEGQSVAREYVVSMSTYLRCIVDDEKRAKKALGTLQPDVAQGRHDNLDKKYKAAIKEMEKVATQINAEAEKFRKQNSK